MDHLSPLVGMLSNMQVFIISLLLYITFRMEVKPQADDTPSTTLHLVCRGFFFLAFLNSTFFLLLMHTCVKCYRYTFISVISK